MVKHRAYVAVSFAASVTSLYLRYDMQNFIFVILCMNIICGTQLL